MTTMNNEDPAAPSVHEPRVTDAPAEEPCGDNPAADVALPPPVAWVQPDHLQKARMAPILCRVEPTQRHADFVPIYTADQMRAAIAAERAQDSAHRSAQAAVYAALGPGADPDRATWPDQIRALRERADALARAIAAVAGIAHDERASA